MAEKDVDRFLTFLNELVLLDREAVENLIETRVKCNQQLASHPTVQVMNAAEGAPIVGLLGILNGLVGVQPEGSVNPGWGYIAASFDDNEKLVKFIRIDK